MLKLSLVCRLDKNKCWMHLTCEPQFTTDPWPKADKGQEKLLREGDTSFGFLKNREDARLKKESDGRGDEWREIFKFEKTGYYRTW